MVDRWDKRFPPPDEIESPEAREERIDKVARTMSQSAFDAMGIGAAAAELRILTS